MALVNQPTAALDFTWKDASGSISHTLIHVPYATLASVAIAAADALVAAMAPLSDAVNLGYSLTYKKVENAPDAATDGSRVEEKGVFIWGTSNARTTRFTIPAIQDDLLNVDGSIDRSNALIIALVTAVTDVGTIFASADGSDIVGLLEAYQRFNSSTKNQLPSNR